MDWVIRIAGTITALAALLLLAGLMWLSVPLDANLQTALRTGLAAQWDTQEALRASLPLRADSAQLQRALDNTNARNREFRPALNELINEATEPTRVVRDTLLQTLARVDLIARQQAVRDADRAWLETTTDYQSRVAAAGRVNVINPPDPRTLEALRAEVSALLVADSWATGIVHTLMNVYTFLLVVLIALFALRLGQSQERTRTLEQLEESRVQLIQAEKLASLGRLIAGVAHEMNTPLMYVMNNAQLIRTSIEEVREWFDAHRTTQTENAPADEEIAETLDEIGTLSVDSYEGLEQISELVASLKDFSRLDRAPTDRFSVNEGLERTLVITRNLTKTGVQVDCHFDPTIPEILCSPSRINQVFVNLITNAVHAMEEKGTLTLTTGTDADHVVVEVQDTGCGIPDDVLPNIFDPFFTTKPVGTGTGLGLSIVHSIVEEHGGRLEVDSKLGVGTTFRLSLPRQEEAQAA